MNLDFQSLTQNKKFMLYATAAILVSLFLPWWSSSFSANMSYGGQNFGSSSSNSLSGYQLSGGILPILICVATAYFIFNNAKNALWCGIALFLYAGSTYFGIIPAAKGDISFSGSMGGVSAQSGFQYGLYIFAVGSAVVTFLAYREMNEQVVEANNEQTQQ